MGFKDQARLDASRVLCNAQELGEAVVWTSGGQGFDVTAIIERTQQNPDNGDYFDVVTASLLFVPPENLNPSIGDTVSFDGFNWDVTLAIPDPLDGTYWATAYRTINEEAITVTPRQTGVSAAATATLDDYTLDEVAKSGGLILAGDVRLTTRTLVAVGDTVQTRGRTMRAVAVATRQLSPGVMRYEVRLR